MPFTRTLGRHAVAANLAAAAAPPPPADPLGMRQAYSTKAMRDLEALEGKKGAAAAFPLGGGARACGLAPMRLRPAVAAMLRTRLAAVLTPPWPVLLQPCFWTGAEWCRHTHPGGLRAAAASWRWQSFASSAG